MAHFVLVHGMFHGGWCWDRVKTRLEHAGHTVDAPDLAGCGTDQTPPLEVTLDLWASDIAARARAAARAAGAAGPVVLVVLVGHSRGGMVISQAAEQAPDDVAALVYLTALMLPDGISPMTLNPLLAGRGVFAGRPAVFPQMNESGTALLPGPGAVDVLYAACSPADSAWAIPQIGQEPMAPLGTPLALSEARYGRIPRIYIEAETDTVLPISLQRAMISLSPPAEVMTLPSDHMPIFTHVTELTAMLEDIAARYAGAAG